MRSKIIIGTRASALAMAQAEWVAGRLSHAHPGLTIVLEKITTRGDTITDVPLARIEGKGVFTKELERALLDKRTDLAVHSMKDLPAELPPGLGIACVPEREDPHDVLICREGASSLAELPNGAVIGTSSLRRAAQIRAARPDAEIIDIRGNVDTRLRKLHIGTMHAIVLARAGLNRLSLAGQLALVNLPFDVMLPAAGQGALAIETRRDDAELRELLAPLHHHPTYIATCAERMLLGLVGGGCHVPLGVNARHENGKLSVDAILCTTNGRRVARASASAGPDDWQTAAQAVWDDLAMQGAIQIMRNEE